MNYELKIETDLNLPHELENEALNKLIRGSLKRKQSLPKQEEVSTSVFWDESAFFLSSSSLYSRLPKATQTRVLETCNALLMSDFYFLEKSGLAYCAKMILLAPTTEVRQLYALIASDEATHLESFVPYVPLSLRTHPQSKLMYVLGSIIEECDLNSLYYLVQTIMEGWGAFLYGALANTCCFDPLKALLKEIRRDEMIHHKTGEALFQAEQLEGMAASRIYDRMKAYTEVLRVGPQMVIQAMERESGELTKQDLQALFSDLRTESVATVKLALLKQLMTQPGMESFVQKLEDEGYMKPYSPAQCAAIYQENRHQKGMF